MSLFTSAATRFMGGSPWREPWEKCAAAKSPVSMATAIPARGDFFRRFAAPIFVPQTHGWRRGLPAAAAPQPFATVLKN